MRPATPALSLSDGQRETLMVLSRSQTASVREVRRARALLLAVEGIPTYRIAAEVGASPATVSAWRERFSIEGLSKLGRVRKGRGRKPTIPQQVID